MPDITMCKGDGCSAAENCYRYRAIPNRFWQSYFVESPGIDKSCKHFEPLRKGDKIRDILEIKSDVFIKKEE